MVSGLGLLAWRGLLWFPVFGIQVLLKLVRKAMADSYILRVFFLLGLATFLNLLLVLGVICLLGREGGVIVLVD